MNEVKYFKLFNEINVLIYIVLFCVWLKIIVFIDEDCLNFKKNYVFGDKFILNINIE